MDKEIICTTINAHDGSIPAEGDRILCDRWALEVLVGVGRAAWNGAREQSDGMVALVFDAAAQRAMAEVLRRGRGALTCPPDMSATPGETAAEAPVADGGEHGC